MEGEGDGGWAKGRGGGDVPLEKLAFGFCLFEAGTPSTNRRYFLQRRI